MTYETLQYVDANGDTQEVDVRSLSPNGVTSLSLQPRSHSWSDFVITLTLPPESPIDIPFKSRCVIRACRRSATGGNNSFTGGEIIFQGRRTDNSASASSSRISTRFVLSDALWDLAQLTYKLPWRQITGGTLDAPVYTDFAFPDIVLFGVNQNGQLQLDGTYAAYDPAPLNAELISTWQQIVAIVAYAKNYATGDEAVQLTLPDEPEFTPNYRNTYPVRSVKCLQCLTLCLQSHPGVFTEIDHSTTPPTLHFRDRAHMTAIALPYKSTDANGITHVASDISNLPQLKPDRIGIYYKINGSYNGQPTVAYASDIYPAAGGPYLLTQDYSIDVSGAAIEKTIKNFTSAAFNPLSKDLWRLKVPPLKQISQGGQIPNDGDDGAIAFVDTAAYDAVAHPKGIQVIDESGAAIDYAGKYVYYTDDAVYSWFKLNSGAFVSAIKATVKTFFTYKKKTKLGSTDFTPEATEHEHSFRVLLTDAPSAQYSFQQTTNTGESIPPNLAQSIWTELQELQWRLHHEIWQVGADENTIPTFIKPGRHKVNLIGGDPDWESMNAVPETVSIEFHRTADGRLMAVHSIDCGPVHHLEPGYLVQIYNMFANRNLRRIDTSQRLTGLPSGQTDLSASDSRENSVPAQPIYRTAFIATPDGANVIQLGADDVSDAATPNSQHRWLFGCDESGNTIKTKVLCTEPEVV